MGELFIERLHNDVNKGAFGCGNDSINEQVYASYYPTLLQHGYAFQVSCLNKDNIILGYYMIKFRSIKLEECPGEIAEYYCNMFNDCCALHICYVAVDSMYQGHKIGTSILKIIIRTVLELRKKFPILLITIDALKEKFDWYTKLGFLPFCSNDLSDNKSTISMYIDCIENRKNVYDYIKSVS